MRTIAFILIAAVLPAGAGADDELTRFVQAAAKAGATHDLRAFDRLYCTSGTHKLTLNSNALPFFTRADAKMLLEPRRSNAGLTLQMCFEPPGLKEECQIMPAAHVKGRLCLLDLDEIKESVP